MFSKQKIPHTGILLDAVNQAHGSGSAKKRMRIRNTDLRERICKEERATGGEFKRNRKIEERLEEHLSMG